MRYVIKYSIDDREVQITRNAISSLAAITKLTDQYGWSWQLSLVDADTRGEEWCSGLIDTNGGINYRNYVVCNKKM
jgi:hypothetical protein